MFSPKYVTLWCGKAEGAETEEEWWKLLNYLEQHWSHLEEGIYWIFLWRNSFWKGLFFTSHISRVSLASSAQGMIAPSPPEYKEQRDFSQANSLSFNFYTEIFSVTHGIFLMGFSHAVPVKLQSTSPKSLDEFQNHRLDALTSIMISLNWVHQFPIQHFSPFFPGKRKSGLLSSMGWILEGRFDSQDVTWYIGKIWILKALKRRNWTGCWGLVWGMRSLLQKQYPCVNQEAIVSC